jgi:excisionase family DNA binding protein
MAKISLISWRRREKKFPETEAQRRARARELISGSDQCCVRSEALDVLEAVPPFELLAFDEEHLMEGMDALALRDSNYFHASAESTVRLDLTTAQSRALLALPLFSGTLEEQVPPGLFQVHKSQDHRRMTLQFSLYAQTIPEMISLKDVCHLLRVGRRTIMRLIRRRELRCYRIANRYRFAVEDVKHYLDRIATY